MKQNEVLEIYISGYIAALNSMFWKLPKKYDDQSTMYRTGWNTCLNEIRSHIKKQIKMISKKELFSMLDKRIKTLMDDPYIDPSSRADRLKEIKVLRNNIESLPDDQPDLLPFQWPVPDGMEVVTRDGRKVVKIDFWEMLDMPVLFAVEEYSEPFTALPDGRTCLSRESECDLFLRRKEKKVWVVEWPDGYMEYYPTMDHADHRIWSRNLPESTDRKHGGEPKKYEATLKPVV